MVMLSSQEKANVGIREPSIVDFDVLDQKERTLFHTLEGRCEHGLISPSRCEGTHSSSLQERLFQLSPSPYIKWSISMRKRWCRRPETTRADFGNPQWPTSVAGPAVLLFASGLALNSRFAGQPNFLQTRHQLWGRAQEHRSLRRGHSPRSLGAWRRCQSSNQLGILTGPSCEFVLPSLRQQGRQGPADEPATQTSTAFR